MLQAIRSKAGSFVVKGLFVLLIAIFGIWGIGDIFRNRSTDTVIATVGDQSIHAEDLQAAMRRELERLSARFGASIDIQQAKKLGIVDNVLDTLIDGRLLDQEAARLRLEVSDEVIRNAITDNPKFRTPDGHFDRVSLQCRTRRKPFDRRPVRDAGPPRNTARRLAASGGDWSHGAAIDGRPALPVPE